MTLALVLTASVGHSQSKDTVCLPIADAKRKLVQIERLKLDSAHLVLQLQENAELVRRVASKDQSIQNLRALVATMDLQLSNVDMQLSNYRHQVEERDKGIKKLERDLRRQKTKTILTGIGGILAAAGVALIATH